jgi:hypothetical protein
MQILVLILSVLCILLTYKLYKYSIVILKTEEAIEECLDVLNERYESMSKILDKEIFFDSIEVRQVINDIKLSHDAVYLVALKMIGDKRTYDNQIEEKSKSKESKGA